MKYNLSCFRKIGFSKEEREQEYTHTCNLFTTRVEEFHEAIAASNSIWLTISVEIIAAVVEPCQASEVVEIQKQKEKVEVLVTVIKEKVEKIIEEIASLVVEIQIAISKTTTTTTTTSTTTSTTTATSTTKGFNHSIVESFSFFSNFQDHMKPRTEFHLDLSAALECSVVQQQQQEVSSCQFVNLLYF